MKEIIILFLLLNLFGVPVAQAEKIKFETNDKIFLNGNYFKANATLDKRTAVLVIEGSGKSDFESESENSPFIQLGKELSLKGFHVLTFNKRGSGENSKNGSFWKATFTSDCEDSISALNFLKTKSKAKKVILIGHSFGGPQSLSIARKEKIDGIIMLTSTIRATSELQIEQTKIIMELQNQKPEAIDSEIQILKNQIATIENDSFKCIPPRCELKDGVEAVDHSIQVPWWREVLDIDFANLAENTKVPVHFIFGTSDAIIPDSDLIFVKNLIENKKLINITFSLIDKLDHFMVENENKKESLKYAMNAQKTKNFNSISQNLIRNIENFLTKENN